MYIHDQNIKLPIDPDTIVWKYLDLSKFLDMLMSQKLFMSRSDKFEDQYEGTFSEPTFEELKKLSSENPKFLEHYKKHREKVVISSWHINEYESFAMWQIFTQNTEGLAIQSTIGRLQKALDPEKKFEQYRLLLKLQLLLLFAQLQFLMRILAKEIIYRNYFQP